MIYWPTSRNSDAPPRAPLAGRMTPLARELHLAIRRIHATPETIARLRRRTAFCRAAELPLYENTHGAEHDELRLWFEIARRHESGLYRAHDIARALGLTLKQVRRAIKELRRIRKA